MKNIFTGFIAALAATLAFAAAPANAGNPIVIVSADGLSTYGTDSVLWARKDTSPGYNRVKTLHVGGGEGYVKDDAGWNKFAKITGSFYIAVAAPGAPDSLTFDAAKYKETSCPAGKSVTTWSTVGMPNSLDDACAFANAAKAAANSQ